MAKQRDRAIVTRLSDWFRREARDLPWRRARRSAYRALVAEVMLQQTQVARVVERYGEFLKRFPSVRRLAEASEEEVLSAWRGLGYYRRARSLYRAARVIVAEFGGRVPRTSAELLRLPGIGRFSAGSLASVVFGEAVPIVDGNVLRVLARLEGKEGRASDAALVAWAWGRAGELVGVAGEPGVLNEGLMELGATVCTPRGPVCSACPVGRHCRARRAGRQEEIPGAKVSAARRREHHHAVVVRRGRRVLVERRGVDGMWAGMWQVPTVEARRVLRSGEVVRGLQDGVQGVRKRGKFVHSTTHREITFHVFVGEAPGRNGKVKGGVWRGVGELDELPMSNAQRRVLEMGGGTDGEVVSVR